MLNAYDYDSYINGLSSNSFLSPYKLDEKSTDLLLQLVHITDKIAPVADDRHRCEFFLCIPSPTLEEYVEGEREGVEEYAYEEYGVDDATIKESYKDWYPEKKKWYHVTVTHEEQNGRYPEFIAVFIENNYVLSYNDPNSQGIPRDASEFIADLISRADQVVIWLEEGTYNKYVSGNLPPSMRYGIISRKAYYDFYPDARKNLHEDLSDQDIADFANYIQDNDKVSAGGYKEMTARKYFEAAAIGIRSVKYEYTRNAWKFGKETQDEVERYKGTRFDGSTPRLIYMGNADGRDDGLTNLPLDDYEAFQEWQHKKGPYYVFNGTHPWEIRTSMSISLSIHLYPYQDKESGLWYFILSGDACTTCNETVHYYLAMRRAGIPVVLQDAEKIAARFLETDNIGVVPDAIYTFLSTYVPDEFRDDNVGDITNLPDDRDERKKMIPLVTWKKVPEVRLAGNIVKKHTG